MKTKRITDDFKNEYRVHQPSLKKTLHRISQDFVRFGYFYWSKSKFPATKNLDVVIARLAAEYSVIPCRELRRRARKRGEETGHILFWGDDLYLFSSSIDGRFGSQEKWFDVRTNPVPIMCYTVGLKHGKPWVQMSLERYLGLRKKFRIITLKDYDYVQREYDKISPFSYQGIVEQKLRIRRMVNPRRKAATLPRIEHRMNSSMVKSEKQKVRHTSSVTRR